MKRYFNMLSQITDLSRKVFKLESGVSLPDETPPLIYYVFQKMAEENRHYHSLDFHIIPMIELLLERAERFKWEQQRVIDYFYAILFHDVVYNPRHMGGINEDDSANVWLMMTEDLECSSRVASLIKATYGHESEDPYVREFLKLDLAGFKLPLPSILRAELLIRKEYGFVDWSFYKESRIKFLTAFSSNSIIEEMDVSHKLLEEIQYLKYVTPNIGVYVGSFNPFHIGHMDILKKAELIFDKVIVVFAVNSEKPVGTIREVPDALINNQVEFVSGSIVEWMESKSYPVTLIRGLRNSTDLIYEQNYLASLNMLAKSPIKSVNIFADPSVQHISSSQIKQIAAVNKEVAEKLIVK